MILLGREVKTFGDHCTIASVFSATRDILTYLVIYNRCEVKTTKENFMLQISTPCPRENGVFTQINSCITFLQNLSHIHTKAANVERLANQRLHLGQDKVSDWLDARCWLPWCECGFSATGTRTHDFTKSMPATQLRRELDDIHIQRYVTTLPL
ncbi:hypothetical protein TNCV_3603411 [Trichonephila clavipes]|nr:hypothetical protein TNCV_3603411 [Trichonephila clavipes]